MLFKRKSIKKQLDVYGALEFRKVMEYIQWAFEYSLPTDCKNIIEEKTAILEYMLTVIKADLQYSLLTDILYKYPDEPININRFMPYSILDENLIETVFFGEEMRVVDFSQDCVISIPWKHESMIHSISHIFHDGFDHTADSYTGQYFEVMNVCYITNGYHHTAAGIIKKVGTMKANVYHTELAFEHISTDGGNWYNIHTGAIIDKVLDFRIALLYEIAKMKNTLINSTKTKEENIMPIEKTQIEDMTDNLLTEEDSRYIEEMAGFYSITLDEAFGRFISGNIDGIILDDEEPEFDD